MSGRIANMVREMIAKDDVVIFSKSYCPYCDMAKKVFDNMVVRYTVIELDKRSDGDQYQDVLKEMTGERSVPRVFVKGKCIGGGTDTKALHQSGQLQAMLD
ncbi:glutaredoxin-2, mitochondrial-like isoform X2 [Cloeon dipterum]